MGLADSLARTLAAGVAPLYDAATLWRPVEAETDAGGSVVDGSGGWTAVPVMAQVEAATAAMRLAQGYAATDVRILVLARRPDGRTVPAISTDCEITARGRRYQIASVQLDAAGAYYELRGRA